MSAGRFHNCALKSDGSLACWGKNDNGESSPPSPTVVHVLPTATFTAPASVTAGTAISLALTNAADPGYSGTPAATFTYAFDCGTGTGYGAFSETATASCPTTASGTASTRTVKGTVKDQDGDVQEYTGTVQLTVSTVATTTVLTVTPSTTQYSDKVTLTATVSPADAALTGSVQFRVNGVSQGSPVTVTNGVATLTDVPITLASNATAYALAATFTSTNADYLGSADNTKTLAVSKEDAAVSYSASNPAAVQVSAPGGTSPSFILRATVAEKLPDVVGTGGTAAPGDITKAAPSITLSPVGPGSPITSSSCTQQGSPTMGSNGYGTVGFSCSFSGVPVNTYDAVVSVTGGYYTGSTDDVVTVYDPSLGFATGGGTITWPGTSDRTNFGFTMSYGKNGSNVKGNMVVVGHLADGTIYRVKSNALSGLALSPSTSTYGYATFTGKATYQEPIWSDPQGNHGFTVYVEDRGQPGAGADKVWLQVAGSSGMSMSAPATSNAQTLTGGNVSVPHGKSLQVNSR